MGKYRLASRREWPPQESRRLIRRPFGERWMSDSVAAAVACAGGWSSERRMAMPTPAERPGEVSLWPGAGAGAGLGVGAEAGGCWEGWVWEGAWVLCAQ